MHRWTLLQSFSEQNIFSPNWNFFFLVFDRLNNVSIDCCALREPCFDSACESILFYVCTALTVPVCACWGMLGAVVKAAVVHPDWAWQTYHFITKIICQHYHRTYRKAITLDIKTTHCVDEPPTYPLSIITCLSQTYKYPLNSKYLIASLLSIEYSLLIWLEFNKELMQRK